MPESQRALLNVHLELGIFFPMESASTPVVLADLPVVPVIGSFWVTAMDTGFPFTMSSLLAMGGKLPGLTNLGVDIGLSWFAADECLKFLNKVPRK
jgi:hypothetical protein